ncbi:GNAT family N-acetyltransferase [Chachezhania antarctica]|uniref:GNAT family N-acetyltransferase n=1 Tax=Chachezhania antarctica TaxID=2340860 RepID=UPI0013CED5EB|nr:GNAT family N-acetyltransferase [Chachezhania antarctica]|tara:strand:+ start:568 stop:978 length:411 start_codon:yes stop_codon:yes gene_type:complete
MTPDLMARIHLAAFAQSRPWTAGEFESLLSSKGTRAVGDDRAFALYRVTADEAELLTIATDPGHRRHGLARALMDLWQMEAHAMGAARAFLEVSADNGPAFTLYLSCGYEIVGRRKDYYQRMDGLSEDALVMQRTL